MKLLSLIVLLFIHPYGKALEWSDFRGRPKAELVATGVTAALSTQWSMENSEQDRRVTFVVYFRILFDSSWTTTDNLNVLRHEQGHADISHMNYVRFLKSISKYQGCKESKKDYVISLFNKAWKESENLQKLYDKETKHGANKTTQRLWELNIDKEIKRLQ